MAKLEFPDGKRFAFTIFDDTDGATLENVKPVYDLLGRLGIITTKSVWVVPTDDVTNDHRHCHTLSDPEYMDFVKTLYDNGFEIALHNVSMGSSKREAVISALDLFKDKLGFYPRAHVNHELNRENLYWGHERLDNTALRAAMKLINRTLRDLPVFQGHEPHSPYFWGDVCQNHIDYVRNFVFREINLMRINPTMPYQDPRRPFVKYWFSSSEGGTVKEFNRLLSSSNQERLEKEGGVCIAYTHFGGGFTESGRVNPVTEELLTELSGRPGWFVPVSTLLDFLLARQERAVLPFTERLNMELKWFLAKLMRGSS